MDCDPPEALCLDPECRTIHIPDSYAAGSDQIVAAGSASCEKVGTHAPIVEPGHGVAIKLDHNRT